MDFLCQNGLLVGAKNFTISLVSTERSPFLSEVKMKQCYKCKENRPLTEFRQFKSGKNKGYYRSYCKKCIKECQKEYIQRHLEQIRQCNKKYRKNHPWLVHWDCARTRCTYPYGSYFGKVKFKMTVEEFKILWFRDKAWKLKRPSIDRIDGKKDYVFKNCRFIELEDNYPTVPVKQYTLDGKFIKRYKSILGASKQTNIDKSSIRKVCLNLYKSAGGYKWKFA